MSEPNAGSDVVSMKLRATKSGEECVALLIHTCRTNNNGLSSITSLHSGVQPFLQLWGPFCVCLLQRWMRFWSV